MGLIATLKNARDASSCSKSGSWVAPFEATLSAETGPQVQHKFGRPSDQPRTLGLDILAATQANRVTRLCPRPANDQLTGDRRLARLDRSGLQAGTPDTENLLDSLK